MEKGEGGRGGGAVAKWHAPSDQVVSNILNVHLALFREILSPGPSDCLPVSCQSMLRGVRRRGGGAVAERRGGRSILSDSGADSSILFIREERLSEGGGGWNLCRCNWSLVSTHINKLQIKSRSKEARKLETRRKSNANYISGEFYSVQPLSI